jgi:hypothetical protein
MPALTQLAVTRVNGNGARSEALFASGLQPADAPDDETITEAIEGAIRRFGLRGCAGRMAQEFGDHPEVAARRMRWVRQLTAQATDQP